MGITFYEETDIWKNDKNGVVLKEVYKITHTWKKFGDTLSNTTIVKHHTKMLKVNCGMAI